ncbi:hypothetical protein [Methylobacterium sp. SI9]|uniref:hypothetical protein n=1 Tax=Methylobacterium guangdongense TaxID=3138811 RepID=UPI00313E3CCA
MTRIFAALALACALSSHAWAGAVVSIHDVPSGLEWGIVCGAVIGVFLLLVVASVRSGRESTRGLCALAALTVMVFGIGPALALDSDGTRPDPVLTPGAVRTADRHAICAHATREFRHVTVTEKVAARRAYGIMGEHGGWCGAGGCEIDHRIPLTVGGGNPRGSIANLWPQRADGPFGFHVKDRCEASVGRALCAGRISVEDAQAIFRGDWTVGCAPYLARAPRRAAK